MLQLILKSLLGPAAHWDHERFRIPLNRPPGTFSPTGGEGWDEGVRFMESPHVRDAVHWVHEPRTNRTVPPTKCCRRLVGRASLRFLCRQDAGSTLGFRASLRGIDAVHWDDEPVWVVPSVRSP